MKRKRKMRTGKAQERKKKNPRNRKSNTKWQNTEHKLGTCSSKHWLEHYYWERRGNLSLPGSNERENYRSSKNKIEPQNKPIYPPPPISVPTISEAACHYTGGRKHSS